ncbi:methyltransferase domain-containing protein [Streptomyces sp. NPDC059949]|uniref:methyltransferase domain-containing protein n=1 Tax=Streptomyces sp. NPDC059949 TaxID=3347013 RepID=UPI00364ABCA0
MNTRPTDNAFARIDAVSAEMQGKIIDYLDVVAGHPEMQRVRTAASAIFAPSEGERLLDAGCGAGEVARELGAQVGGTGAVFAVDRSQQAVAVAQARHDGGPVTYLAGDVTALDFPDDQFDGVRCERVMQHLADPDAAITELARVTRPGGRVCVIDTDWASSVGDGFDHLDEVVSSFFTGHSAATAGRSVRSRMVRSGLRETSVLPVTLRFLSPADAEVVAPIFSRALMREHLSEELFDRFFSSVDRSADRGDFLYAFTMWISLGHVALT